MDLKNLKPGIYRHYKGNEYRLIGQALHTETEEQYAVYQALYGDEKLFVRPLEMFLGEVEVDGKKVKRFEFIND